MTRVHGLWVVILSLLCGFVGYQWGYIVATRQWLSTERVTMHQRPITPTAGPVAETPMQEGAVLCGVNAECGPVPRKKSNLGQNPPCDDAQWDRLADSLNGGDLWCRGDHKGKAWLWRDGVPDHQVGRIGER